MMDGVGQAMDSVVAIFERPDVQAGLTRFTEMIGTFITQAVSYIPVLIDGFFQFIDFLQQNQGIVVGVLAALGVAASAWGVVTAAAAWTAMAPLLPVIAVLVAIAAVAYLVYQAWTNNWGGIRDYLMGVWENLQPTFETLKQWLAVAIPVALDFLKQMWNNFLTSVQVVWAFLQNYVFPVLGAIADVVGAVLSKAWEALAGIMQNVIIPALQDVWKWIDANVMPVVRTLAGWLQDKLGPAFEWVGTKIGQVVDWLHDLADRLRNMELPDWMTPGSPTPWEIGLLGVGNALDQLSRSNLPRFEASLALQPVGIGTGGLELPARDVSAESGPGRGSAGAGDDAMQREIYRMLRDLPQTIATANRDMFEKAQRG